MALSLIDTQNIAQLIAEFRALQERDSVSPESLGAILDQIVALLAKAPDADSLGSSVKILDNLSKLVSLTTSISTGTPTRDAVRLTTSNFRPPSGISNTLTNQIVIPGATMSAAGAMTADQVFDLTSAKSQVAVLSAQIASLINRVKVNSIPLINVYVENNELRITGHEPYIAAGYIPYIFRATRKRNRYNHCEFPNPNHPQPVRKGWNLYGSRHAVKIVGSVVHFANVDHQNLADTESVDNWGYTTSPEALIIPYTKDDGKVCITWGCNRVVLYDPTEEKERMLRFKFCIAFGPAINPGRRRIQLSQMISPLARFCVIYDPGNGVWRLSRH